MRILSLLQNKDHQMFAARTKASPLVIEGINDYKTRKMWMNTVKEFSDISCAQILSGKFADALKTVTLGVKIANVQRNGEIGADVFINETKINEISKNIDSVFKDLFNKYISKNSTQSDFSNINSSVGEIRWNLARSLTDNHENETIANVFIRAIYKSLGMVAFPLKKGISLNREANSMDLKDYKNKFYLYFEKEPKIVGLSHIV